MGDVDFLVPIDIGRDLAQFRAVFGKIARQLITPAFDEFLNFLYFTAFEPDAPALSAFVDDKAGVVAVVYRLRRAGALGTG